MVMKTTGDSRVYKSARRYYIAIKTGKCPICKPHRGENRERWQFSKSWKHKSKRKHQWR